MPELHRNPTADPDATHELHGPQERKYVAREYAICLACVHGHHDAPGPNAGCACACHQPAAVQAIESPMVMGGRA